MVRRLNQDEEMLEDRSRGALASKVTGGVGEQALEISLEPVGEYSPSVVAGVLG